MKKTRILLCLCALFMIVTCTMLGFRNDGERLAVTDATGAATIAIDSDSAVSLSVCLDEDNAQDPPSSLTFKRGNETLPLELTGPRPLDIPANIADAFGISGRQKCAVSETFDIVDETEKVETATVLTDKNAFVIAAVSSTQNTTLPAILFFAFLASIIAAFSFASQSPRKAPVVYKRYDGILGFFFALILAAGFSYGSMAVMPQADTLFPGYGEMMVMVAANFAAFLLTFLGITGLRHTSKSDENQTTSPQIPVFKPWISIGLGVGLAVAAAISILFAPLPGLSTLEMASQLTSTLYMSAFFAVLAGVAEECLFRGMIQASFEAREGARHPMAENVFAIAIATGLFVSLHVPQSMDHPWALIPIGLVSIVSGILKIRFKSISPCILLHMSYNATLLIPSILL